MNNKGFVLLPLLMMMLPLFMAMAFTGIKSNSTTSEPGGLVNKPNVTETQSPVVSNEPVATGNPDSRQEVNLDNISGIDNISLCNVVRKTVNETLANEQIYKEVAKKGKSFWFFVRTDERNYVIIDGLPENSLLGEELRETLTGRIKNPVAAGANCFKVNVQVSVDKNIYTIGHITVDMVDHEFEKDIYTEYTK